LLDFVGVLFGEEGANSMFSTSLWQALESLEILEVGLLPSYVVVVN
jgi:hypothetical protein